MTVKREHINASVMFDHFYGTRSGIGIMYMTDFAGDGILTTNTLTGQYSFNSNLAPRFAGLGRYP